MIEFHANDITTHVPTCCLIEDYWMLRTALESLLIGHVSSIEEAKETIATVMEYLEESIDRYTQVKSGLQIVPSVTSVIAMGCQSGIIMDGVKDLCCAAGKSISNAGITVCNNCPYMGRCNPDDGVFLLDNDVQYKAWGVCDEDELVCALKAVYNQQPQSDPE